MVPARVDTDRMITREALSYTGDNRRHVLRLRKLCWTTIPNIVAVQSPSWP